MGTTLFAALTAAQTVWVVFAVLAFFAIGSFTNVVIVRLPVELDEPNEWGETWDTREWSEVFAGNSRCDHCDAPLRWYDNIPVVSWLALRGKCRSCGTPIPAFHPFVELAVPALALAALAIIGWDWRLPPVWWLIPVGVAITVIDFRTLIVPTRLVWPAFWVAAGLTVLGALSMGEPTWLLGAAIGAVAFAGPLFLIWFIHPRGMGFGDVRLAVLLGWTLGYSFASLGDERWVIPLFGALIAITVSALVGIVMGLALVGFSRKHIPFGPALIAGTLITIALAEPIRNWVTGA